MAEERTRYRGPSTLSILQIMLIGLKLAGLIDWPWRLVFAPFIVYFGVMAVMFLLFGIVAYAEYRRR